MILKGVSVEQLINVFRSVQLHSLKNVRDSFHKKTWAVLKD